MMYVFVRFPDGKAKAVTFSYDDGVVTDPTCTAEGFTTYTCKNNNFRT